MRVGDKVWHSHRKLIDNALMPEYEAPKEITTKYNYLTCMPLRDGYLEVLEYGERKTDYWCIIANARIFGGKIKEGDLFWVDGEKPNKEIEEKYGVGASANAVVKSVEPYNFSIKITLEKNQSEIE